MKNVQEKITLEFPINADLFDNSTEYGKYCYRTITNYQYLIDKAETPEQKGELMKDLYRHLVGSSITAVWSQMDYDGVKGNV